MFIERQHQFRIKSARLMSVRMFLLPATAARNMIKASAFLRSSNKLALQFQRSNCTNGFVHGVCSTPMSTFPTCYARTLSTLTRVPTCPANNSHPGNMGQTRTFTEDKKTTALTLIKDLKHLRSSPIPALVLGVAGVIPFAAAPTYIMMSGQFMSSIAFSQVAYGACILSFLGGVRWGLTVSPDESIRPDWFNLGYSVSPSLVAWVGLMLPTSASILVLISGLLGACFMDVTMHGYPPWFKALRFLLTFMAVLSLWTTLMCRLMLGSDKKPEKKVVKEPEEKKSWLRLPWKSSKPKQVAEKAPATEKTSTTTEVAPTSVPVVDTLEKTEERVVVEPPMTLPLPPLPEPIKNVESTNGETEEKVPEKK